MTNNNHEAQKEAVEAATTDTEKESRQAKVKANSATTLDVPTFGWSGYAERVNGRFAMIGFIAILVIEAASHGSFLHWAGLLP